MLSLFKLFRKKFQTEAVEEKTYDIISMVCEPDSDIKVVTYKILPTNKVRILRVIPVTFDNINVDATI